MVGDAVPTLGGADYGAAGFDDLGGSGEALYGLVQVQVERVAAVGGDHYVERLGCGAHGDAAGELAGVGVLGEEFPGMDAGDAVLVIHGYVYPEADTRVTGDLANGIVYRVALGDGPGGVVVADEGGGMELHYGLDARETRGDHFRAAAESGEEMGLDEAKGYADVGVQPASVEQNGCAVDGWGGGDKGLGIEGVVADDGIVVDNVGAEHALQFIAGVGPVSASGDKDSYPFVGDVIQLTKQYRKNFGSGYGSGDVADGNSDAIVFVGDGTERKRVDGIAERVEDGGPGVGEGWGVVGFNDRSSVGGQLYGQPGRAVCQFNSHLGDLFLPLY